MSARKMVADSTQELTKKRKKEEAKKKRNVKKRKSEEPEDPELMDLTVDLKPISGYIRNPEEMVEHMFKSLRGTTLTGMLPDILRVVPVDELKELCLNELEVMSRKRVKRIIAGEDPDEISSSDSDDELESESEEDEEEVEEGETQEDEADEEEEGAISISEEEEEEEEVASLEEVSDDEELVSDDNRDEEEEEGAMNTESLDDVSSVESPSDFRQRSAESEEESEDGLEIKPRPYGEDVEDGEVMSSGDEDCDPTWRTRGEEEVERQRRESESKKDEDDEFLLHAESPKPKSSSPLPSTSKEIAPAAPIPSTSKQTHKPSKNQKRTMKKSSSMDDIEMEEVCIGEEVSEEDKEDKKLESDTEKDEGTVEVVEESSSPEVNLESVKVVEESANPENDQEESMEVVDPGAQKETYARLTMDDSSTERKEEDLPAASVVEEKVEESDVPMEKSEAEHFEGRDSTDKSPENKEQCDEASVVDLADPTEHNPEQQHHNEIPAESNPNEVDEENLGKLHDTNVDVSVKKDEIESEVVMQNSESIVKDDSVEEMKLESESGNIPVVEIKSETEEKMDTALCLTVENISEVVKEEPCRMDTETKQADAENLVEIAEVDSKVKQSDAEILAEIPVTESDANQSEVENVETVTHVESDHALESTTGTAEVKTAEIVAEVPKSEPKTVSESARKEDIMESSVGSPASADDIFAAINRISEGLVDEAVTEKPKESEKKEKETKEMEKTEPPDEEHETETESPFKSKRGLKVSRPHLRSHNKDPPSPASEHSDTNAVEASKPSTSSEPKKVMFDDSKNKVIRLTDSKKQKAKTKVKVDIESQPNRGSILSSKSKKSNSKPSTSSGRTVTSQSSSSDVTKQDDVSTVPHDGVSTVPHDDVDDPKSKSETVELAQGSSELLELEMRARAIRAMLKAQDP